MKKIPRSFDWRTKYELSPVQDQGKCSTCWAIATVTCFQDVIKISSSGKKDLTFNMKIFKEETKTGDGNMCEGGSFIIPTFQKFLNKGCVLGNGKRYFPRKILTLNDDEFIEEIIYRNGPIIAMMKVYLCEGEQSLYNYKKSVYGKNWWDKVNFYSCEYELHCVVIVGWGVEDDVPYWIVRNSWGKDFGEGGYFKILRGKNFCHIEEKLFTFLI